MVCAHDNLAAGHLGIIKTRQRLGTYFYWPRMQSEVAKYVKCCKTCQMTAPILTNDRAPLEPLVLDAPPMSDLAIDIMGGDLPVTAKGNKYLLVIICNVSKFTHAIPLRNLRAKTICDKLVEFFCFVGLPKVIRCDQMSSFRSELMTAVCEKFGIDLKYSCAFHSESNPMEAWREPTGRWSR